MHEYSVGKPYIAGRTNWPEGQDYNYRSGAHEFRLFFRGLTSDEVKQIRQGECEFGLYVESPLIVLLYRFGTAIPWSDAPYTYHLVPPDQRTIPDTTGMIEPHALLNILLVDTTSGIIRGLRAVSLSPAFTAALHLAIRDQAMAPFDPGVYDRALARLYQRYPTTAALLAVTKLRTVGGA